jgi:ribonuclease VapC
VIVVDTSAIVAVFHTEASAPALLARIEREKPENRFISTASYLEAGAVFAGRRTKDHNKAIQELDDLIADMEIGLAAVDEKQARLALDARIRFGRGFGGPGGLNFGDCFAYALAKSLGAPLLYVGNDFAKTDIVSALSNRK